MLPKVTIVDEKDNVIGADTFWNALENERIRRVVRVFLANKEGKVFLQRRSKDVAIFPDRWDHAASGHVDEGEGYEEAVRREMREEIGIDTPVEELGRLYMEERNAYKGKVLRGWHGIFLARSEGDAIVLKEGEVSRGEWFSPNEVDAMIKEKPNDFTTGFLVAWEKYSHLFR